MIIRPNPVKIDALYTDLKSNAKKLSKVSVLACMSLGLFMPILMVVFTELIDGSKSLDADDIFGFAIAGVIAGAIIGIFLKPFIKNLLVKNAATLISEIKNSGIKIENELVTGRMLKIDEAVASKSNSAVQVIPRKSNDVAFKLSQVSNVEVADKVLQEIHYSKFCTITVGADKYYLMCIDDNDAFELRNYILNFRK